MRDRIVQKHRREGGPSLRTARCQKQSQQKRSLLRLAEVVDRPQTHFPAPYPHEDRCALLLNFYVLEAIYRPQPTLNDRCPRSVLIGKVSNGLCLLGEKQPADLLEKHQPRLVRAFSCTDALLSCFFITNCILQRDVRGRCCSGVQREFGLD